MKFLRCSVLFGLIMTMLQCSTPPEKIVPLFSILSPSESGIDFTNPLPESTYMNGLFYEYYYNGSGVAVGDFDNDGLADIYFVSTFGRNKLYINQNNGKFKDVTAFANAGGKAAFQTGVTTVDINNDGWLDIYVCASGRISDPNGRKNELYIHQGLDENGYPHFKESAKKFNLDLPLFSTQAAFFDYDRDGDLDMFLINHGIDAVGESEVKAFKEQEAELTGEKLYRNDGGQFKEVTKELGIISNRLSFGLGVAIGDLNNDGWPDIYVGHDYFGKDHCYINDKGIKFNDRIDQVMRHTPNFSMGNDIADFNNDGWLDIISVDMMSEDNYGKKTSMSAMNPATFHNLVALGQHYQYMVNAIQMNNGVNHSGLPHFSEVAQLLGASNTDWSWSPLFFDMDNDGHKDLFISNGIKRDFRNNDFLEYTKKLRREHEEGTTVDQAAYVKKVMSKIPARYKPNYFFKNNGSLHFSNMGKKWSEQRATCSNGAAYADFDNDGDLDLVLNNTDSISCIQWNNSMEINKNRYIAIKFKGNIKNIMGIGARVTLHCGTEIQSQEHYLTRGFQSSVAPGLHFGLGTSERIDRLEVAWPDGKKQVLEKVKTNRILTLHHRDAKPEPDAVPDPGTTIFKDITLESGLSHKHTENDFDDFERESLLPHKMSRAGPALAVGDVNNDGLDDFFIGGAMGYPGSLYLQKGDNTFEEVQTAFFKKESFYEDAAAKFFDADNDGDLDLYISSGGNERNEVDSKYYKDRLYENKNGLFRHRAGALPDIRVSSSCIKPFDYDADGDLDLFVGGRQVPGRYPLPANSYILRNDSNAENGLLFTDVTPVVAPGLEKLGMVTDAVWVDIDNDGLTDLVISGEWMPVTVFKNKGGFFEDATKEAGLSQDIGWWFTITAADLDGDGDTDLTGGNLGLNYKYRASKEAPFEIYATDFDDSGNLDIVLSYHDKGTPYPLRGRECSSNQMPFIKEKFATYDAFGRATLHEVYGEKKLKNATHYAATNFANCYFENNGTGHFKVKILPMAAQISSINTILVDDFDKDGKKDLLMAGNLYGSEVETPRNDASYGSYLKGGSTGNFIPLPFEQSGLLLQGEVRQMLPLKMATGEKAVLIAINDGKLTLLQRNF